MFEAGARALGLREGSKAVQPIFDMSGRVAVVTGASRGLGRAMALGLARAGADVVVASRTLEACQDVAGEIDALGRRALAVRCDVAQREDTDRLVDEAWTRLGRCDALVNNAGLMPPPSSLEATSDELFDACFAVNVKGPLRLATRMAGRMGAGGGGAIVNVVSIGGLRPGPSFGAYCASKAALQALTRVMAAEWAPRGVRVNALAPGPFHTDMLEEMARRVPGFLEHSAATTMQKRVAEPAEIVGAVLFLCSAASSFVTGQTLSVCGGYT